MNDTDLHKAYSKLTQFGFILNKKEFIKDYHTTIKNKLLKQYGILLSRNQNGNVNLNILEKSLVYNNSSFINIQDIDKVELKLNNNEIEEIVKEAEKCGYVITKEEFKKQCIEYPFLSLLRLFGITIGENNDIIININDSNFLSSHSFFSYNLSKKSKKTIYNIYYNQSALPTISIYHKKFTS